MLERAKAIGGVRMQAGAWPVGNRNEALDDGDQMVIRWPDRLGDTRLDGCATKLAKIVS